MAGVKRKAETDADERAEKKAKLSDTYCEICRLDDVETQPMELCWSCQMGQSLRKALDATKTGSEYVTCEICNKDPFGCTRRFCVDCREEHIQPLLEKRSQSKRRSFLPPAIGTCTKCGDEDVEVMGVTGRSVRACVTCFQATVRYPSDVDVASALVSSGDEQSEAEGDDEGDEAEGDENHSEAVAAQAEND